MGINSGPGQNGLTPGTETKKKIERSFPPGAVEQSFEKYFKKNKIEAPPIEVLILFTRHHSLEDAAWIEQHYKEADIFVPEAVGWDEEYLARFQEYANGVSLPIERNMQKDPFSDTMRKFVKRNPGKKIAMIDIPGGTEKFKTMDDEYERISAKLRLLVGEKLPFDQAVEKNYQLLKAKIPEDDYRERKMIASFPGEIARILKEYPELKEKKSLKVVMYLGAKHTRLFHWLKQRGENVNQKFQEMPHAFVPESVVTRSELLKKGLPLKNEIKEQAFFSRILFEKTFLQKTFNLTRSEEFTAYLNFIMKNISSSEMKNLYELLITEKDDLAFKKEFEKVLKAKNVPIIKTSYDVEKVRNWVLEEDRQN